VERQPLHLPAQSALLPAFMVKNAFKITRIWLGLKFNDYWSSNLNVMLKIEFLEKQKWLMNL
jgi:hypothetical protein